MKPHKPASSGFSLREIRNVAKRGSWKVMLPLSLLLLGFVLLALHLGWNLKLVGAATLLVALVSNLLLWLLGLIAVVPIAGPLVVKVLALPFIWLVNGVGYLVSYVAIRRGYSQDVITYRALTIALIVGIIIGFVLGNLT